VKKEYPTILWGKYPNLGTKKSKQQGEPLKKKGRKGKSVHLRENPET